jgi:hypothetical protein
MRSRANGSGQQPPLGGRAGRRAAATRAPCAERLAHHGGGYTAI